MIHNPRKGQRVVAAEDPDRAPNIRERPHEHAGEIIDFDFYGGPVVRWSTGVCERLLPRYLDEATP